MNTHNRVMIEYIKKIRFRNSSVIIFYVGCIKFDSIDQPTPTRLRVFRKVSILHRLGRYAKQCFINTISQYGTFLC